MKHCGSLQAPACNGAQIESYNIDLGEKRLIAVTEPEQLEYVIENLLPETSYK